MLTIFYKFSLGLLISFCLTLFITSDQSSQTLFQSIKNESLLQTNWWSFQLVSVFAHVFLRFLRSSAASRSLFHQYIRPGSDSANSYSIYSFYRLNIHYWNGMKMPSTFEIIVGKLNYLQRIFSIEDISIVNINIIRSITRLSKSWLSG